MNRTLARLAAGFIAGTALAASPALAQKWKDDPQVKALYAKAKAEGEVNLWGPTRLGMDWIQGELDKVFPGIKIKMTPDLAATTKIIAEARAGKHSVDAYSFALGYFVPLVQRDLMAKVDYAGLWGVDAKNTFFESKAAATHNLVYSFVYNDKLVKESELPKTWTDLLHPRWKNRLTASSFLLPNVCAYLALSWGEERATKLCRGFVNDVNALATRAPREAIISQGERHASIAEFTANAEVWRIQQGLPIRWSPMTPTMAAQFVIGALKNAPHPNAAQLLAGWLATDEGKLARERERYDVDVREGTPSALGKKLRAQLGGEILIEDTANMERRAVLSTRMSEIISGQRK